MRAGPRRRQQQQRQRELPRSPGDGASGAEVNDVPPGGPSDENHAKWCRINVIRRGPPLHQPRRPSFRSRRAAGFPPRPPRFIRHKDGRAGLPPTASLFLGPRASRRRLARSPAGDKSGGRGPPAPVRETRGSAGLLPPGPPPGARSKTGPSPESKQPLHKGLAEPETSSRADSAPGGTPAKLSGARQRLGELVCPAADSFGLPRFFLFTPFGRHGTPGPGFSVYLRDLESLDCSQSPPTWVRTNTTLKTRPAHYVIVSGSPTCPTANMLKFDESQSKATDARIMASSRTSIALFVRRSKTRCWEEAPQPLFYLLFLELTTFEKSGSEK